MAQVRLALVIAAALVVSFAALFVWGTAQLSVVAIRRSGPCTPHALPIGALQSPNSSDTDYYALPRGYQQRPSNNYDPEPSAAEKIVSWQYRVYEMAGEFATQLHSARIIDVGCGSGVKLAQLRSLARELVCIDIGENLRAVSAEFPFIRTVEIDLNTDVSTLLSAADLTDSVIVNADNIEHIVHSEGLIRAFKIWMVHAAVLLISTPDRVKHGHSSFGPPPNQAHVREWSLCEFVRFFSRHGPPLHSAGWTENNNAARLPITLFAVAVNERHRKISIPKLFVEWTIVEALECLAEGEGGGGQG